MAPGGPWADRDQDPTDFLEEVERIQARDRGEVVIEGDYPVDGVEHARSLVQIAATHLAVEVRATMLVVQVVERGNKIFFLATFPGEPDEVFFSYVRPGEQRPVVDPGFGQPGSCITRVDDALYMYTMDTTGFPGGVLNEWHFWGTGEHGASAFEASDGEVIRIPHRKPQLL